MKKTCIIIMGPTAVGKTSLGIELAKYFSTEIISADSRQCFKELSIGVAKPSTAQLQAVPHHFINSHSIYDNVNAAVFEQYALGEIEKIFSNKVVAVMVGGTGLYIKAFCEGIDQIPATIPGIREEITAAYKVNGIGWLQKTIMEADPAYYQTGEIKNPHRLMRALEVKRSTGKSILEFQRKEKIKRDFDIFKIGLELPRQELYERINERVEAMVREGLEDEVMHLVKHKDLNALQTVGYQEMFRYLTGELAQDDAVKLIQQNTRHYAKRQMTWFKKDEEVKWCEPDLNAIMKHVRSRN